MYGISTAWRANLTDDGNELIDLMQQSGINHFEIDYRITPLMLRQIKKRLRTNSIAILTVHAFCPIPDGVSKMDATKPPFALSSLDPDLHRLAVKYGIQSLELGAELQARLTVFHLGHVEMNSEGDVFERFYQQNGLDSEAYHQWLAGKLAERDGKRAPYFDQVLKALDILNERACQLGILIGAENRYRFTQIPFQQEFDVIFDEFAGGNVRYWHDVGHAEVLHRLRILHHVDDLLERHKFHLAGMHIHDVHHLEDHLAPGQGDFPFESLSPYLNAEKIKILEIHSSATPQVVRDGVVFLREKGLLP